MRENILATNLFKADNYSLIASMLIVTIVMLSSMESAARFFSFNRRLI